MTTTLSDYEQLIDCLRDALASAKSKGMTRAAIAFAADVTETTIYNWLNKPAEGNAVKIIKVINVCGFGIKFTLVRGDA